MFTIPSFIFDSEENSSYVDMSDFKYHRDLEQRKIKSRVAARSRRGKESQIFADLAAELPLPEHIVDHLDKGSLIRVALAYLKTRSIAQAAVIAAAKIEVFPKCKSMDSLILSALDGFFIVISSDGDVIFISENVNQYLGVSQVDILGQSMYELTHPCEHSELREVLNAKDLERRFNVFFRMKCTLSSRGKTVNLKSASYKLIQCTGHVVETKYGAPNSSKGMPVRNGRGDTAEERNSDSESESSEMEEGEGGGCPRRESGNYFVAVCQPMLQPSNIQIPLGFHTFLSKHSLDMKFTYADEKVREFLGYSSDAMLNHSAYEYHHAEDSVGVSKSFSNLFQKGQCQTDCYRFLALGGGFAWVVTEATLIYNVKGHTPKSVVCINFVVSGVENASQIFSVLQLGDSVANASKFAKPNSNVVAKHSPPKRNIKPKRVLPELTLPHPDSNPELPVINSQPGIVTNASLHTPVIFPVSYSPLLAPVKALSIQESKASSDNQLSLIAESEAPTDISDFINNWNALLEESLVFESQNDSNIYRNKVRNDDGQCAAVEPAHVFENIVEPVYRTNLYPPTCNSGQSNLAFQVETKQKDIYAGADDLVNGSAQNLSSARNNRVKTVEEIAITRNNSENSSDAVYQTVVKVPPIYDCGRKTDPRKVFYQSTAERATAERISYQPNPQSTADLRDPAIVDSSVTATQPFSEENIYELVKKSELYDELSDICNPNSETSNTKSVSQASSDSAADNTEEEGIDRLKPSTTDVFVPLTEDMNKDFLAVPKEDDISLTALKEEETDDLTHLAPTAGGLCVPLDSPSMNFILPPDIMNEIMLSDCNLLDENNRDKPNLSIFDEFRSASPATLLFPKDEDYMQAWTAAEELEDRSFSSLFDFSNLLSSDIDHLDDYNDPLTLPFSTDDLMWSTSSVDSAWSSMSNSPTSSYESPSQQNGDTRQLLTFEELFPAPKLKQNTGTQEGSSLSDGSSPSFSAESTQQNSEVPQTFEELMPPSKSEPEEQGTLFELLKSDSPKVSNAIKAQTSKSKCKEEIDVDKKDKRKSGGARAVAGRKKINATAMSYVRSSTPENETPRKKAKRSRHRTPPQTPKTKRRKGANVVVESQPPVVESQSVLMNLLVNGYDINAGYLAADCRSLGGVLKNRPSMVHSSHAIGGASSNYNYNK